MAIDSLNVLVVDDEVNIRKTLSLYLGTEGHSVVAVSNWDDAVAEASRRSFDLALVDLRLGMASGLDLIPLLLAAAPWIKIIVITAFASIDTAVEAMRRGAADYLPKPFTPDQVGLAIRKVIQVRDLERKIAFLRDDLARSHPEVDFSTDSAVMQRALSLARQVAPTDATVLLTGESGTGKTLLARRFTRGATGRRSPWERYPAPHFLPSFWRASSLGTSREPLRGRFAIRRGANNDRPASVSEH